MELTLAAGLCVLLVSNVWLLREVDVLRRQLDTYQREVASLDDRVCQLMYSLEGAAQRGPSPLVAGASRRR